MNLLIFVSESVLHLDKLLIYEFYYDYMIPKWGKRKSTFYAIFPTNLKIVLGHRIMIKEEEKYHYLLGKKSNWFDKR